jgi:hypothetical protein
MAKDSKTKVPKKIAGVKVPKAVRKSKAFDTLLGSPFGREVLAGALVAAAGAAASYLMKHRPSAGQVVGAGKATVEAGADAASATKDLTRAAAAALADLVTTASARFLPTAPAGPTSPVKAKGAKSKDRKVVAHPRSKRAMRDQRTSDIEA